MPSCSELPNMVLVHQQVVPRFDGCEIVNADLYVPLLFPAQMKPDQRSGIVR